MTDALVALAAELGSRVPAAQIVVAAPAGADVAPRLATELGRMCVLAHPTSFDGNRYLAPVLHKEDLDVHSAGAAIWPGGHTPGMHRMRRIDTLYAGQPIDIILLADARGALGVLDGASQVLAQRRPAVLLDRRTIAANAILGRLPDYRWEDTDADVAWARPSEQSGPPPRLEPRRPTELVVAFDAAMVCGGMHLPEPDDPLGGRWTGAGRETWFALPRPVAGRWRLRIEAADWGNTKGRLCADVDLHRVTSRRNGLNTFAYGPIVIADGDAVLRVELFPPRPVRDLKRGPRMIGVRLLRAVLQPV